MDNLNNAIKAIFSSVLTTAKHCKLNIHECEVTMNNQLEMNYLQL